MSAQFIIELKGLRFFAHHGLYAEEAKVGNEFEVDVFIAYKAAETEVLSIEQTINYAEVFRIVKDEFSQRKELLETCAMQMADRLQKQFPQIESLTISIKKLNPPIINFVGSVSVTFTKAFK
ncbi:MAG: dihydroneopterin aldolase [Flavisolibacter sp.]|jgi:dihydroneopterin aldolase